jgi:hypothetical protein
MAIKLASIASLLALAALVLPACAATPDGDKAEPTDETTQAFGLRDTRIAGSLDYGQTSALVAHTGLPRYRAFKFAGAAGDEVDVWVRSANGDPVTWILDNDWRAIARNDDAAPGNTDSHVKTKLPANPSATHYIVVRDYAEGALSFKVELKGTKAAVDFTSGCNVDADCAKVDKGCCSNYGSTAVLASKAGAYTASLTCAKPQYCPMFMAVPDHSAAECNNATKKCELVKPADITCGSFIMNSHACPDGYSCKLQVGRPDVGGKCVQFCGGIAGIECHDASQHCVDDPSDSCDPAHGGADCGGICQ